MDLMSPTATACPKCGEPATGPTARFCENCGALLAAELAVETTAAGCANCGAGLEEIDEAGFCTQCGLERHRAAESDHWEIDLSPRLAGVCDLGVKRLANEDCMALGEENPAHVLVVCDGVSQTRNAASAATTAAPMVCEALLLAVREKSPADRETSMHDSLKTAHRAVAALSKGDAQADDAAASTIVAALIRAPEIVLGWLGDSRAYWIGDTPGDARLLTKDHSWVNEVVDAGQLTYAEARTRKGAHAVTRSLGGPSLGNPLGDEPSILRVVLTSPGWLLLCSDGLWGYAPEPAEIAGWLHEAADVKIDAIELARALIRRARACGGRDNITATLLRLNGDSQLKI